MTNQMYRERAKLDTRKKADLLAENDALKKRLEEAHQGNQEAIDRADYAEKQLKIANGDKRQLKAEVASLTKRVSHLEGYLQRIADEDQPSTIVREEQADTTPTPLRHQDDGYHMSSVLGRRDREEHKEWYDR